MTRHGADAMIAGRRRHLALAETTIGAPTVELVTAVLVASHHPPLGGIVSAVTRYRGRHLVRVRVLCRAERAHGTETETVLVITIAEEMIHGTGTLAGIVGVDEDVYHREYLPKVCRAFCLICLSPYLENPAPPLSVPPLHHIEGSHSRNWGKGGKYPTRHIANARATNTRPTNAPPLTYALQTHATSTHPLPTHVTKTHIPKMPAPKTHTPKAHTPKHMPRNTCPETRPENACPQTFGTWPQ